MLTIEQRILGCLLGGAIGDALGAPIEFRSLPSIRAAYGPAGLTDYDWAYGKPNAVTDDSQLTLFTVEGLVEATRNQDVDLIPSLYRSYRRWLYTQDFGFQVTANDDLTEGRLLSQPNGSFIWQDRGPGSTCLGGLRQGRLGTAKQPLNEGKGCGVVMRSAPFGMVDHLLPEQVYDLAVEAGYLSHGHPSATHSGGALAMIIRLLTDGADLRTATRAAMHQTSDPDTKRALATALGAIKTLPATPETVESLGEGWHGDEALSISVYCALVLEHDPQSALLLAVNHGGDSDSTGAICGNILGALHGVEAFPQAWVEQNEARTLIHEAADRLVAELRHAKAEQPPSKFGHEATDDELVVRLRPSQRTPARAWPDTRRDDGRG